MFLSYLVVFIVGLSIPLVLNLGKDDVRQNTTQNSQVDLNSNSDSIADHSDRSYIDSLQKLIAEYENKLSSLEEDNQALLNDLLDSEGKVSALTAKPTISKKIQQMSDEEIYEKVGEVFKERYLKNIDNPKQFAQRLADVALSDDDEKTASEDGTANSEVRISVSRFPGYQEMTSDQVVASKNRRLYVNMISSLPVPNALIKWKNMTEDKVIMFRGLAFHSQNESQYVWGVPKDEDGWKPGVYQVSVFQINNELQLLATKTYSITEVIDEGPEPVPDVPQHDGPPKTILRQ